MHGVGAAVSVAQYSGLTIHIARRGRVEEQAVERYSVRSQFIG